ncbi:MAG: exosortase/archaeosortase family protein [Planctomycetaceae bacterium]
METRSILTSHEPTSWACPDWRARAAWTAAFCAGLWLLFGDLMASFINRWATEPQYSHGFAIPLMACGLGWFLFDRVTAGKATSNPWGLAWISGGVLLHIIGVYVFIEFADSLGLLCCIAGGIILIWGQRLTLAIWPAILFLVFMFPLPFRIERLLSGPLQLYGAEQAAWYIRVCGIPAVAQGSMILMGEHKLGVAEACSGMRMLTVFIAISVATMIISRRTLWEKLVILFSAVPIALICNITRIVATALAYQMAGPDLADLVFHDLSGWLMMPGAMLLLYLLLKTLDWLFISAPEGDTQLRPVKYPSLASVPSVSRSRN